MKAHMIAGLGKLMRLGAPRELPAWSAGRHRVLFLRYDRIGDMVLATGLMKAIVAAQPTVTLDVLASVSNAAVLHNNPHIGSVFTIDKKRPWTYLVALWRIRRARYDAVVDSMVLAPSLTSLLLMWLSGARHRIGISNRGNDNAFTIPVDELQGAIHSVDRSGALLAAFGADLQRIRRSDAATGWGVWRPEIFLTAGERRAGEAQWLLAAHGVADPGSASLRLVVNVSASSHERYWPEERFIQTLLRLRAHVPGMVGVVIGSPHDSERMARIGAAAKVSVAYTPEYRQMMAIVATSDLVFTADTSVTHVGSAFSKPVVVMFLGNGGALWGPYGTAGQVIPADGRSLNSIRVDTAVETLQRVIGTLGGRSREPDRDVR
jgi:ADP-heptose:LPS heptosyltransferase